MAEAATVVDRELDIHPELIGITVSEDGRDITVTLSAGGRLLETPPAEARSVIERLEGLADERPEARVRVDLHQPARRRALAVTGPVPGYGWRAWRPVAADHPVRVDDRNGGPALVGRGLVVDVDHSAGTWSLNGTSGLGRLVDDGDAGDTYNYSPPAHDQVVDEPGAVAVRVLESGPVRAAVEVATTYDWPTAVAEDERTGATAHEVRTRLEVRADERFVRVSTSFVNRSRDHRLRAWFPLPRPTTVSTAECAFGTVDRGLTAEGGPTEKGLPTFPSRRFVVAGGLTIAHEGLLEYELVDLRPTGPDGTDQAHAIALTLLRATGMLSQGPMTNRPLPAGPCDRSKGPSCRRRSRSATWWRRATWTRSGWPTTPSSPCWWPTAPAHPVGHSRTRRSISGARSSRRSSGGATPSTCGCSTPSPSRRRSSSPAGRAGAWTWPSGHSTASTVASSSGAIRSRPWPSTSASPEPTGRAGSAPCAELLLDPGPPDLPAQPGLVEQRALARPDGGRPTA